MWVPSGIVDYIPIRNVEYVLIEMLSMHQAEMLNVVTKWEC